MTALSYDVAKLLKDPDNRFCADCQAPLTSPHNVFASLRYGIWICTACAEIHGTELLQKGSLKKALDNWTPEDVKTMQKMKNNVTFNKVFERYVPAGWERINQNSSVQERRHWIKAKYYSHYFTVPQTTLAGLNKIEISRKKRIATENVLPTRIVDYFLVLGASKVKNPHPGMKPGQNNQQDSEKKIESLEDIEFKVDIIDSFPAKNSYEDTPIPELVGPIVFPSGLKLSKNERAPFTFSFVLTDINRVKLYGTTLIVYEMMDLDLLAFLLGSKYSVQELKKLTGNLVYYMPKALTIISHYSFYQLFRKFLEQMYHVSLSSSPLPIERYLLNFMKELPLPPQGKIEILYSLPQIQLSITRPPKNALPMIDFSYRPLFSCLSVDHILIVFSCLCLEMSICFTSRNIALLTPVQEALLSLLFPFVWQGCYVPILPIAMVEMLDAPVPLLAGINLGDLEMMQGFICSNENIVFVDLDQDKLTFGWDVPPISSPDEPINEGYIPPLPTKSKGKLKSKLDEFGGVVYKKDAINILKAGYPFPNNEHLTPIKSYISEQGVISNNKHRQGSIFSTASQLKSGIRKLTTRSSVTPNTSSRSISSAGASSVDLGQLQARNDTEAVPFRHPCACTLITSSNVAIPPSILDVENNFIPTEQFDAKEIREAFLRFFVASFADYQDYLVNPGKASASTKASKRSSSVENSDSKKTQIANDSTGEDEPYEFDKEGFKLHLQDDFLGHMVDSQMFSNFLSEKFDSKNPPMEIIFFDENILAKKNRSKLQLIKTSTPFLSDTKDYLHEIFTTPLPSTFGIPENYSYHYPNFPNKFNANLFGNNIRKALILVDTPEIRRFQDDSASNYLLNIIQSSQNSSSSSTKDSVNHLKNINKEILNKITNNSLNKKNQLALLQKNDEFAPRESDFIGMNDPRPSNLSAGPPGSPMKPRYAQLQRKMSNNVIDTTLGTFSSDNQQSLVLSPGANSTQQANQLYTIEEKKFYKLTRDYFYFILSMIITIQSSFRRKKYYFQYKKLKNAVRSFQISYRYYHLKQLKKNTKFMRMILKIQTSFRRYYYQRLYQWKRSVFIRIQARYRRHYCQKIYKNLRQKFILIQSFIRKFLQYQKFSQTLMKLVTKRKRQISLLWMIERTSLYYRSLFWFIMNNLHFYIPIHLLIHKNYHQQRTDSNMNALEHPSRTINRKISRNNKNMKLSKDPSSFERKISCLTLAFYDEECRRLYESIGFDMISSPFYIRHFSVHENGNLVSFNQQFEMIEKSANILKLKAIMDEITLIPTISGEMIPASPSASDGNLPPSPPASVFPFHVKNPDKLLSANCDRIDQFLASLYPNQPTNNNNTTALTTFAKNYHLQYQQEQKDRAYLYEIFQKHKNELKHDQENYMNFFNISERKRRKRKICEYVFMNCLSDEYLNYSAEIVLNLLDREHHPAAGATTTNNNIYHSPGTAGTANTTSSSAKTSAASAAIMNNERLYLTKSLPLQEWIHQKDWLMLKKQQLMTKYSLEVIRACLLSIERLRTKTLRMSTVVGAAAAKEKKSTVIEKEKDHNSPKNKNTPATISFRR